jgi:hypothetical protein
MPQPLRYCVARIDIRIKEMNSNMETGAFEAKI